MKRILITVISVLICCVAFSQQSKGLAGVKYASSGSAQQKTRVRPVCHIITFGVESYKDDGISSLKYPDKDCKAFLSAAKSYIGFERDIKFYHLPEEGVKRTFQAALESFDEVSNNAQNGDWVLLYLSGHGMTAYKQYYFPLYDSELKYFKDMLTGSHIASFYEGLSMKGVNTLVFLDTCHSGSMAEQRGEAKGAGSVAIFPATTPGEEEKESAYHSSSEFGKAVCRILGGVNLNNYYMEEIRVGDIGSQLQTKAVGKQAPLYLSAKGTDFTSAILVKGLGSKRLYLELYNRYYKHILEGDSYTKERKYDDALDSYDSAKALEIDIHRQDVEKFHLNDHIKALNQAIAKECQTKNTQSSVWESLSLINENSPSLDISVVKMSEIYLNSGYYYKNRSENSLAFDFFRKAYDRGNVLDAPYEMAMLSKKGVKSFSDKQIELWLTSAANAGNEKAREELNPGPPKIKIYGSVSDKDGPIIGCAITEAGTKNVTISDLDGNYLISVPEGAKLVFSCKGYVSQTVAVNSKLSVTVNGKRTINVVLKKDKKHSWVGERFNEDMYFGLGLASDFKYYPIGARGGVYWGLFHLGAELMAGNHGLQDLGTGMSAKSLITIESTSQSTRELTDTETTLLGGNATLGITPGLFYKYVSADCTLGVMWAEYRQTDTYTTSYSDGREPKTDITEFDDSRSFFILKPGITGFIPLGKTDAFLTIGARYRICPKDKSLNGFEASLGLAWDIW